jgi:adenylylsulfate kinase-like enzyme
VSTDPGDMQKMGFQLEEAGRARCLHSGDKVTRELCHRLEFILNERENLIKRLTRDFKINFVEVYFAYSEKLLC